MSRHTKVTTGGDRDEPIYCYPDDVCAYLDESKKHPSSLLVN
jgi:hypothetical protein